MLLVSDLALILISGFASLTVYAAFHRNDVLPHAVSEDCIRITLLASVVGPFFLRDEHFSATPSLSSTSVLLQRLLLRLGLVVCGVVTIAFLTRSFGSLSRIWLIMFALSTLVATSASRVLLVLTIRRSGRGGALRDVVALVGSGALANSFVEHMRTMIGAPIEVLGVFDDVRDAPGAGAVGLTGSLGDLVRLCERRVVDRVVVTFSASQEQRLEQLVRQLKALDVQVALCPPMVGAATPCEQIEMLGGVPVIVLSNRPIRSWGRIAKLLEDKLLGGLLFVFVLPVFLAIMLLITMESPGPVIFRQRRHGWNNTVFEVLKFRTMTWVEAVDAPLVQTRRNDKRVTRVGRVLRRTSLDELPQLLNVLLGEMSLVGPRPHPVAMRTEDRSGDEIIAEYAHRHRVKPGITGWAQINGCRGATETVQQVRDRVSYDLEYIENWSLMFDLKILIMTPLRLVLDRNAF